MRRYFMALSAILAPLLMGAAPAPVSYRTLLDQVPGVPANVEQAYAQWVDNNGELTEGPALSVPERNIRAAQANVPSTQAVANVNAMAERFATPEGQAELDNMTPAQQMALAQQMARAYMPAATPTAVSDHDQILLKQVGMYPGTAAAQMKLGTLLTASGQLLDQWRQADAALGGQEFKDRDKLKKCGEGTGPSGIAVRDLALSYVPKHAALAETYLPKFANLAQQWRETARPQAVYADNAVAAWNQIQNPTLKQQTAAMMTGAANNGVAAPTQMLPFVTEPSKLAAKVIANRYRIQRDFADAKGCS